MEELIFGGRPESGRTGYELGQDHPGAWQLTQLGPETCANPPEMQEPLSAIGGLFLGEEQQGCGRKPRGSTEFLE